MPYNNETKLKKIYIKKVPIHKMEALSGETIYLPCNVSTYEGDDAVLILWYREDKGTPIYRYVRLMGKPAIYLK